MGGTICDVPSLHHWIEFLEATRRMLRRQPAGMDQLFVHADRLVVEEVAEAARLGALKTGEEPAASAVSAEAANPEIDVRPEGGGSTQISWKSNVNGVWSDANNWTGGPVPGATPPT